jgi:hypothetical protein
MVAKHVLECLMVFACGLAGGRVALAATAAQSNGVVRDGNVRFTVITPTLIRMEYSNDGQFVDRRSYFAWERGVKPPQYTVTRAHGVLTIATSRMKLEWKGGADGFNAEDLSIAFENGEGGWKTWNPGDKQTGNLGGTLHALDGNSGAEPLADGVVSRDGWYLYRDSSFLVSDGAHPWMQKRPASEVQDWYFFGYGQGNYPTALEDLTTVSGRIPIPPRYMLGSWRSRYYSYTQNEFQQLALNYDAKKFPLDVLVMDMGWHTKPHWGSMDWDKQLIPHPTAMLTWLHERGLHVTVNWHPQGGVGPWYSQYDAFCKAMGIDPAKKKVIPFEDWNEKFMRNYFKMMMDPIEKQGVDFWWLDDGGPYLKWDNAIDFWNIGRPGTGNRGASFSRWGGWGDQRYPVFFSGDTSALWRVLRFEVPFSSTGGNVGADYWSNDVSGFRLKLPSPELFTRWVEFGVLSPVFRTHGENEFGNYRIPWEYGLQAEVATRKAYDLRDALFPYVYSLSYLTWKTSLPLLRPLYLEHPKAQEAYDHPEEYEFGPDVLAAPIVTRGMGKAWLGATQMWFPRGTWWNLLTGESVSGAGDRTVLATAREIPVFARGGVPLPMQTVQERMAGKPANPLVVRAYPGPDGAFTMYEDDGTSPAYLHGAYALTPLRYASQGADGVRVSVGPTTGSYAGQPAAREVMVELPATTHPASVTVNGVKVRESESALPGYSYDSSSATTSVRVASESIRKEVTVDVSFRGSQSVQALVPKIVNQLAVVDRALTGAKTRNTRWKLQLILLQFHLQTLLSKAEQEFGPASAQDVQAGLKATEAEQAKIQTGIGQFKYTQARAGAFALADAYVSASVRIRKADEGLMAQDTPRYHKTFDRPTNLEGYHSGVLVRVLRPTGAGEATLAVNLPGFADKSFALPEGKGRMYAYLPMMDATQHPLYHMSGMVTLTLGAGSSQRVLERAIELKHSLLNEWSVAGPFAQGQAPAIGDAPVTTGVLRKSYAGLGGKKVAWVTWQGAIKNQMYERGADFLQMRKPWIDLYSIFPKDHAEAVAVTWIDAPRAVHAKLRVRHNAGIAVWVNEKSVVNSRGAKGIVDLKNPPPDTVDVSLKQGWNEIAVRTDDQTKDWGFGVWVELPAGVVCAQSAKPPMQ